MKPLRKKAKAQEPKRPVIELAPSEYQPSKAELEEDVRLDATPEDVARSVLQPVRVRHRKPKRR